jgi:YggT family protein
MPQLIFKVIHIVFLVYTGFLFVRVVGSWFPRIAQHRLMRFVRFYTDPYLNLFRRLIPPIGGALDLSPLLGFFALEILEKVIMGVARSFFVRF